MSPKKVKIIKHFCALTGLNHKMLFPGLNEKSNNQHVIWCQTFEPWY